MARLTIIVPVYKVEKYLDKCINSVLKQSFQDYELILVDDGSPDKCGEMCDAYAAQDKRIRVIHKENGGLSSARNAGLEIASTELIAFLDSDDEIDKDMYASMLARLDQDNLDVVCCDTFIVRGEKKKFKPRYKTDKTFVDKEAVNEILNGNLDNSAVNKVYKLDLFGDIRYPEGRVYEDVATTYKLFFKAKRVGYICKPFYYYYKREGSIVASAFNSKSRYDNFLGYQERLAFAKKHNLDCVDDCIYELMRTALATATAFFANGEDENSDRFKSVERFIYKYQKHAVCARLKFKEKVLVWGIINFRLLNCAYATMSGWVKRMK